VHVNEIGQILRDLYIVKMCAELQLEFGPAQVLNVHIHHLKYRRTKCCSDKKICKRREENQSDATECFNAIIICSTCFGHSHAHARDYTCVIAAYGV